MEQSNDVMLDMARLRIFGIWVVMFHKALVLPPLPSHRLTVCPRRG